MGEVFAEVEIAAPGTPRPRSRVRCLVDTGSSYTVVPPGVAHRLGLWAVDREELRTAKDEIVPGRIVQADLRVGRGRWLRKHLLFVPDEPLREEPLMDRRTGRAVRVAGLVGVLTLQEARLLVDFDSHTVSESRPR